MKHERLLTVTSLLTVLLLSFHLSDDVVRGFEPVGRDACGPSGQRSSR